MKKLILLFALLFTVSSSFISCRETRDEDTEVELNDDANLDEDVENAVDETGNELEEVGNEVDEEF